MKTCLILLLWFFVVFTSRAENFTWKARLDSIAAKGYYKIPLSPDIVAALQQDRGDIRLFDENHQAVPYLLVSERQETNTASFKDYPILENTYSAAKSISRIVVHNDHHKLISGFNLVVRNSSVEKEITLKGSDNQLDWFIIQRDLPVRSPVNPGESTEIRKFEFPERNYEYFELTMNDKKHDPIHILRIGSFEMHAELGKYTLIPSSQIIQKNNTLKDQNQLILEFSKPYEVSMVDLSIATPGLFFRKGAISMEVTRNKQVAFNTLTTFALSPGKSHVIRFDPIHTQKLILTIFNGDNTPLDVSSVKAYQLSRYLVANLKPGTAYEIYFGDKQLEAPQYDLTHYADSIPALLPEVQVGKLQPVTQQVRPKKSIFFNSIFLWVVMGVIITVLGIYSVKMVREMGEKG